MYPQGVLCLRTGLAPNASPGVIAILLHCDTSAAIPLGLLAAGRLLACPVSLRMVASYTGSLLVADVSRQSPDGGAS